MDSPRYTRPKRTSDELTREDVSEQPAMIDLNVRQSMRILQQARRTGACVTISALSGGPELRGHISSVSDGTLEIVVAGSIPASHGLGPGSPCDAMFTVSSECHGFETVIRLAESKAGRTRVVLRRPDSVWVRQRRRFWRTAVRESSTVDLTFAGETSSFGGTMFNISPDGLACRVDRVNADPLKVGDQLTARFVLDGEEESFSLVTELRGKTPAAGSEQTILRLQFVPWEISEQNRIRIHRATCLTTESVS